ncbi:MAG: glycoside hydrolase family 3 N-terminal domain-containing protein [Lutibacter sp.]
MNTKISALATQDTEEKIQEILKKMTLQEKAGQMLNIGLPLILKGDYWAQRDSAHTFFDAKKFKKYVIDYAVGSIHNTPGYPATPKKWYEIVKKIQNSAMNKTRLGIPVLYGIDNIHGANYVMGSELFPHQIALAATFNTEITKKSAEITSYESRAASLPYNFNPNADVAMNPIWGRIAESFGEDPYLIQKMTAAYIHGAQGKGLDKETSTAVCLKHYIGYAAGSNGKDRANALIPENSLREYYLPPFKAAIDNGAMSVMVSSNSVNGIPCMINKYYLTNILKGELNFKGVIISDFNDVDFLVGAHNVAKNLKQATEMAVNAGVDLLMNPFDAKVVDYIVELVNEGKIKESRIDDAVTRILRLKFYLNLFKKPYSKPSDFPNFASSKSMDFNYKAASEAITLLKNEKNILPLNNKKKYLVTGYTAHSINVLNGAWSRSFLGRETTYNDSSKLTILQAIEKEVGKKNIAYVEGTDYLKDINSNEAVKKAKSVDAIIVCLGEIPATEKPSDINELPLPKVQQELVQKLAKTGRPIILVLVEGRPRIIRKIEPLLKAIVMAYLPGQEGGRAISDVLFGKINPSGKLPYTYPKYTGNHLPYYYKKTDIRDVNWNFDGFYPQFEFGFGLSYTQFEYKNLKISNDTLVGNDYLNVTVEVKNIGKMPGKEIVEVYKKDLVATVAPDNKRLIRFKKVFLQPNEKQTIKFKISSEDLKSIGINNKWIVEEGDFEILVGGNPHKLLKKQFYYKN